MTSKQIAEWRAFAALEPFGERHRDFTFGILGSLTAEMNRDVKKKSDPFIPQDFMPQTYEDRLKKVTEPTSDAALDLFRGLRDSLRAQDKKRNS